MYLFRQIISHSDVYKRTNRSPVQTLGGDCLTLPPFGNMALTALLPVERYTNKLQLRKGKSLIHCPLPVLFSKNLQKDMTN